MAKYKRRKDGRYCCNISTGKVLDNGKFERIMVYGKTVRELEDKIISIKSDVKSGAFTKTSAMPFSLYSKSWLETKKDTANSTYNGYANILKNHVSNLNNIKMSDVVKSDIQEAVNNLSGHYALQCRLKVTLNQIFESAIDDGIIYRNPCTRIRIANKTDCSTKRALTESEKLALRDCAFTLKEQTFIQILYFTGIRRGEALALTKKDINFKTGAIYINKSLAFIDNNQPEIKATKTKNSVRAIPMPNTLIQTLKQYINTIDTLYLFTQQNGRIMGKSSATKMWDNIFNKINEKLGGTKDLKATDLTMHMFRHNYATMLYYQNIDVKQAQILLGHSNIKTTLEIYTHFVNDQNIRNKLDNLAL